MTSDLFYDIVTFDSRIKKQNEILDYIRRNPECNKKAIINFCEIEGIASRSTVFDILTELEKEKSITIVKKGKSLCIHINNENLMVSIPHELDHVFVEFKSFIDLISELLKDEHEIRCRIMNSIYQDYMNDSNCVRILKSIPLLPYILIDVINDIFSFYFVFILSKKIDDQKYLSKIQAIYFGNISKMYSYISNKFSNIFFTIEPSKGNFPYEDYIRSKKYNNFAKVCYLAYLCTFFGIENKLYQVLDYLWIKRIESISLMYSSELESKLYADLIEHERRKSFPWVYPHISDLDTSNKQHEIELLNRIHNSINYFILLDKGLKLDNILQPFRVKSNGY